MENAYVCFEFDKVTKIWSFTDDMHFYLHKEHRHLYGAGRISPSDIYSSL